MEEDTLQIFRRQIGAWIESLLARGRYPFRRVDLTQALLTEAGELTPDLILWINRDSFMAGGLLLVTGRDETADIERGRHCAEALGLQHFLTWSAREVVFWEIRGDSIHRHRALPTPLPGSEPAAFRDLLVSILEELKYLAVAGSTAPAHLPAQYLANLCRITLADVQPALQDALRVHRSHRPSSGGGAPVRQGHDKAFLTLLRLLALHHFDRLPTTVQPEGLERALFFALDGLPGKLHDPFFPAAEEIPLPLDCAVRFHHLLRRLTQLGPGGARGHTHAVLRLLLPVTGRHIGVVEKPTPEGTVVGRRLEMNLMPAERGTVSWQCAPPSILAASALLREIFDLPPLTEQTPDLFAWSHLPQADDIVAWLHDSNPLSTPERQTATARLRLSWPTHRLNLPPSAPRWAWEWLHLLGMARQGATLTLATPGDWLHMPFASRLLHVLQARFRINVLKLGDDGRLWFSLRKGGDPEEPVCLETPRVRRMVDGRWLHAGHPAGIPLMLYLPEPLHRLFTDQLLQMPAVDAWPAGCENGIFLFSRSTLGRTLWRLVAGSQRLPPKTRLRQAALRRGLPLPRREILLHLEEMAGRCRPTVPPKSEIDQELTPWLPVSEKELTSGMPQKKVQRKGLRKSLSLEDLAEELRQVVFVDGLPRFPDHYLFAHFRPTLREYQFTPPLTETEEFFGRVYLSDAGGNQLEAENRAVAQALQLVAATGLEQTRLPVDHEVLLDILQRYLDDLQRLHDRLLEQAHARISDPQRAETLAKSLWQSLKLPPQSLFAPLQPTVP